MLLIRSPKVLISTSCQHVVITCCIVLLVIGNMHLLGYHCYTYVYSMHHWYIMDTSKEQEVRYPLVFPITRYSPNQHFVLLCVIIVLFGLFPIPSWSISLNGSISCLSVLREVEVRQSLFLLSPRARGTVNHEFWAQMGQKWLRSGNDEGLTRTRYIAYINMGCSGAGRGI